MNRHADPLKIAQVTGSASSAHWCLTNAVEDGISRHRRHRFRDYLLSFLPPIFLRFYHLYLAVTRCILNNMDEGSGAELVTLYDPLERGIPHTLE